MIKRKRQKSSHALQHDADSSNSNSEANASSPSPSVGEYGRLPPNHAEPDVDVAMTAVADTYDRVSLTAGAIGAGATNEYNSLRAMPIASEYEDATQPLKF